MDIPRPTKWSLLRVTVLGTVGAWVIPMPWQRAIAEPPPLEIPALGPAALQWLATQPPPAPASVEVTLLR
jgi:hypothetical protein